MRHLRSFAKVVVSFVSGLGLFVLSVALFAVPVLLSGSSGPDLGAGFGLALALFAGAFIGVAGGLLVATKLFVGMTFREMFLGGVQ